MQKIVRSSNINDAKRYFSAPGQFNSLWESKCEWVTMRHQCSLNIKFYKYKKKCLVIYTYPGQISNNEKNQIKNINEALCLKKN